MIIVVDLRQVPGSIIIAVSSPFWQFLIDHNPPPQNALQLSIVKNRRVDIIDSVIAIDSTWVFA